MKTKICNILEKHVNVFNCSKIKLLQRRFRVCVCAWFSLGLGMSLSISVPILTVMFAVGHFCLFPIVLFYAIKLSNEIWKDKNMEKTENDDY